jgi:hypothetical protein
MSKITAFVTVLTLGCFASVAMASPSRAQDRYTTIERTRFDRARIAREPDHFDHHDPADRSGHRGRVSDDLGPRRYRPTWTALGAPLRLTRAGQESIEVNDRGTFTQLRLANLGGTARLDRVIVQFADGSNQVEDLRRVFDDDRDYLEIPLDGNNRRIEAITVIGSSGGQRNLQVYGI